MKKPSTPRAKQKTLTLKKETLRGLEPDLLNLAAGGGEGLSRLGCPSGMMCN